MAQIEPIDAYLGPARTGLAIGAILYQLDGSTVHAAFATTGWYEAPAVSGAWHHPGVSLPDAGGVVVVGVSGTEYMRVAVGAAKPLASDYTATRAAKLDNLDAAVTTRATPAQVNTEVDAALADVGLTTTVTGRIDATITSRGTSTLTTTDIDNRLAAYDPPTKAELDSAVAPLATQTSVNALATYVDTEVAAILAAVDTEIAAIKAKTDNLPASPAATGDIPGTAAIASAIFAVAVETGHDLTTVLRAIYAAIRGRSAADNADDPTTVTYYAPDNTTVRVTHTLTDTERTVA
jgi:hypothetical protein